jgi:hypothetical protein
MAQTAVEWFFEVLAHNDIIDHKRLCDDENLYNLLYSLKNQAKQMEKQQKEECWNVAHQSGRFEGKGIAEENWQTFEQYYNETYGKE